MPPTPFTPEAITFLKQLRRHNSREWFEQNRSRYETRLLTPFRALAEQLAPTLLLIDLSIETRPQVGKTISRIWRDTRFSRNKQPLRDHLWLEFRDKSVSAQELPGFFFYLEIEEWGYGMGFWQAGAQAMSSLRNRLLAQPKQAEHLLQKMEKAGQFSLGGETFRRDRKVDLPPAVLHWYNHKSYYFIHRQPINPDLFSSELGEEVSAGLLQLGPIYHYVLGL